MDDFALSIAFPHSYLPKLLPERIPYDTPYGAYRLRYCLFFLDP